VKVWNVVLYVPTYCTKHYYVVQGFTFCRCLFSAGVIRRCRMPVPFQNHMDAVTVNLFSVKNNIAPELNIWEGAEDKRLGWQLASLLDSHRRGGARRETSSARPGRAGRPNGQNQNRGSKLSPHVLLLNPRHATRASHSRSLPKPDRAVVHARRCRARRASHVAGR